MSKGAQNICFKCDALKRIAARKPKSGLCKEAIGSRILWNTGLFENPDISLRAFFSLKWEAWLVTCTGVYLNVGVRGQRKCLLDRLWGERWTTLHCFHSFIEHVYDWRRPGYLDTSLATHKPRDLPAMTHTLARLSPVHIIWHHDSGNTGDDGCSNRRIFPMSDANEEITLGVWQGLLIMIVKDFCCCCLLVPWCKEIKWSKIREYIWFMSSNETVMGQLYTEGPKNSWHSKITDSLPETCVYFSQHPWK